MEDSTCVICQNGFEEISAVKVHAKGLKTLIRVSNERKLNDLHT